MRRYVLALALALPLMGGCPWTIKCSYHNEWYVPQKETEFRNGKQFGIYEHSYTDEQGRRRICRLVVECNR